MLASNRKTASLIMNNFAVLTMAALLFCYGILQPVNAHLMVAQHGTLNFIENDVYMVLSLPVSGIENIDENKDGVVSMIEFNNQRTTITQQVKKQISMSDQHGNIAVESIILSPVIDHHAEEQSLSQVQPLSQITVMGKFTLKSDAEKLTFHANIFGTSPSEQNLEITAKNKQKAEKHSFVLTPTVSSAQLFE